jgi:N-hydroxyarylamine O-acetyltransferase
MEPTLYLGRIGYSGPIKRDAETLRGLHIAHMQTVPFENLDIGLKRPIRLSHDSLWEKIITQKRGGFCYELNGLFAWLLQQFGFEVKYLNARVYNREGKLGIDFDHLALLVQIPGQAGRWLVDVGFGDSFVEPLDFERQGEQPQGLRSYRLEQRSEGYVVWQRSYAGVWVRQYFFDLQPRRFPNDYQPACLYHQTAPESTFTRSSIISRATPTGRVSLEAGWLILTQNGQRIERPIENQNEYDRLLQQHFGISLERGAFPYDR